MCHASIGFFAFVHKIPPTMISLLFPVYKNLYLSKSQKYILFIEIFLLFQPTMTSSYFQSLSAHCGPC